MTEQNIQTYEDEISLLDILVTLAESWKLLVFGPLIAGLLAGGLSFLWPKTFESVTIVRLNEAELALINSAPVLDPIIEKFGLLPEFDGIQEDARLYLSKKLVVKFDKKTNLGTITAAATTPERAQELGRAAMDALLKELEPKGKEKEAIEQEIAINNKLIADGVYLVERQAGKQNTANTANTAKGQLANLRLNNLELSIKLQAKGKEVFVQEPSLPQRKVSPKHSIAVLSVWLLSGFMLLMFVFVRKAWHSASRNTSALEKIDRIKRSLGIRAQC